MFRLGYNTNGLAHHRWQDALDLIAEAGYQSVAMTVDHHCLNPYAAGFQQELQSVSQRLEQLSLNCVVETGARFLLNPREKHEPTLLNANPAAQRTRIEFLERCLEIAAALKADALSMWSGVSRSNESRETLMDRLVVSCRALCERGAACGVPIAFEPEPGMFIESFADFAELSDRVQHPLFGLTVDIGHVHCVETVSIPNALRQWSSRIYNIHIEDMRRNVHDHLRFGEGEIEFGPVMQALKAIGYQGGVHVELSRHSHMAPQMLRESIEFLKPLCR